MCALAHSHAHPDSPILPHMNAHPQAVFRQAVDHTGEVTRTQWHALQGLARRFRWVTAMTGCGMAGGEEQG